jgi:hypothetical protein
LTSWKRETLPVATYFPRPEPEIEHIKAQIAQSELIVAASEKAGG